MKSVFDACCGAPQSVATTTPTTMQQQPQQPDVTKPATTSTTTTSTNPMSNMMSKVEERVPVVGVITGTFKDIIQGTPGQTQEINRLNANVVTGQGEEKQSFGEVIAKQNLPVVGVFPASSKCAMATIRALSSYPYRNSCAKINCIVRDPDAIPRVRAELGGHVTDSISWSFADYKEVEDMTSAFVGCDRLLLVPCSTEDRAELMCNGIQAAKLAGVKHVVLLSAIVAQHPATLFGRQFKKMETELESLQPTTSVTIMRMSWFMDNFLDMAPDLVSNNRFLSSWGPSGISPIALADIGRASAAVLSSSRGDSTHISRVYHLTGPESISGFRMAEIFTRVFKRPIQYQDLPREDMKKVYIEQMGIQPWQAEGYVEMNDLFKSGAASAWSMDVPTLTNGNHTTLERFLQSKRWYFTGNRSPLTVLFPGCGRIGGYTLAALMKDPAHPRIRAVVRDPAKRAEIQEKYPSDSKLEVVDGDFENPDSVRAAFQGADSVLIVPPEKLERFSFIDSAIKIANEAEANHTVLLSVSTAFDATALGRKFNAWERVLVDNAQAYTIVQSTVFFDLMFSFAEQVKQPEHKVHHWLGNGKFCPVDSRDVGEALASVIREGSLVHHGKTYSLYGPQMVTFSDMTDTLGKVLGYKIESHPDVTSDQVRATLKDKLPSFNIEEVVQAHETLAKGTDVGMTPDLLKLVGRARTVQAFFEDFKGKFTGPPSSPAETQRLAAMTTTTTTTTTTSTATAKAGEQPTTMAVPPAVAPGQEPTTEIKPGAAAIPVAPTAPAVET